MNSRTNSLSIHKDHTRGFPLGGGGTPILSIAITEHTNPNISPWKGVDEQEQHLKSWEAGRGGGGGEGGGVRVVAES